MSTQHLIDTYERALEYLDGGDGWMQNWFVARRSSGRRDITVSQIRRGDVPAKDCKFCLAGAILAAAPAQGLLMDAMIYAPLQRVVPQGNIGVWNDAEGRTYEEVEAMLKKATEKLRQQVTEEGASGNLRMEGSNGRA